jgi:hypothetical protein
VTLFRRSNDIEVSISPEFDKEYEPGETPRAPVTASTRRAAMFKEHDPAGQFEDGGRP